MNHADSQRTVERLSTLFHRPGSLPIRRQALARVIGLIPKTPYSSVVHDAIASDLGLLISFLEHGGSLNRRTLTRSVDLTERLKSITPDEIRAVLRTISNGSNVQEPTTYTFFDRNRFQKHCQYVATYLRKYAQKIDRELPLNPNECYLLGVLHDLGVQILCDLAPETFTHVVEFAIQCEVTFDVSFACCYPQSLQSLSASAVQVWHLDDRVVEIFSASDDVVSDQYAEIRCVLKIADWIAHSNGYAWEGWSSATALTPTVEAVFMENVDLFTSIAFEATEEFQESSGSVLKRAA